MKPVESNVEHGPARTTTCAHLVSEHRSVLKVGGHARTLAFFTTLPLPSPSETPYCVGVCRCGRVWRGLSEIFRAADGMDWDGSCLLAPAYALKRGRLGRNSSTPTYGNQLIDETMHQSMNHAMHPSMVGNDLWSPGALGIGLVGKGRVRGVPAPHAPPGNPLAPPHLAMHPRLE